MDLGGKVVLITGARRLGASVAEEVARRGADVSLSYRHSEEVARQTVSSVRRHGRRALMTRANLSDPAACRRLVDATVRELGQLNALIYMASSYVSTPFDALDDTAFDQALSVDVKGAYVCSVAAAPYLRAAGGGRIVNVSDWVARSGRPRYPGFLPYYVAKSAVIGLTEALALELAPHAILVNAIAPGPIEPPDGMDPRDVEAVTEVTPLGRWGGAPEIVKAIVALLETDFITGETIRVDGGRHLR